MRLNKLTSFFLAMKLVYQSLGLLSLSASIIGAFLPLVPTTCFVLLAAWCFSKSSPKWHAKLRQSALFGGILSSWEQHRVIPDNARKIAIISMLLSATYAFLTLETLIFKVSVLVFVSTGIYFVNKFKSQEA